jgi:Protein of unknown function (DUF3160)
MTRRVFVLMAAALAAVAAGCGSSGNKSSTSAQTTPTRTPTALPVSNVHFSAFTPVPLAPADSPPYAGPATPRSLDGVRVVADVRRAIRAAGVSETLTRQGFVVVPSQLTLFHMAYDGNVYSGWPVFVTTDVAYHEWHQVFDKILRSLEQQVLLPKLETLVTGLVKAAHAQTAEVAGSGAADAASRVEQLFQVAAGELGLPVTLGSKALDEKKLIDAHAGPSTSPILDTKIDYSLFTPRGHYTRNAALTRYFKAMSVLGQSAFCLPGTRDCGNGLGPARMGILAARALVRDPALVSLWRDIYEPTSFLVGLADDYTPLEVAAAGNGLADAKVLADDAAVKSIVAKLVAARPIKINPERASIRFMGTRFVIDSFIFNQLVYPNVGTDSKPRLFPTPLDLAATFGSQFAHDVLKQTGETSYANYATKLAAMKKLVADRPVSDWGSTVYDAWLYALQPMFLPHGKASPDFMRTTGWNAKAQQAGLGSYAELKHDTILYARQVFAEGGDNGIPARRNWVEPEPVAFARLAAVADLMRSGLAQRNLLTKEQAGLLQTLIKLDGFFERIARDELAGKPISKADNSRLTYIGGELEALWWRTSDLSQHALPTDADQDAVVADIASSPSGVLEVGTGKVDQIYVLVPDDQGKFQVAVGGVYSYYEFKTKVGERLTDESWRALLVSGKAPARPAWEKVLLPSG